MTSTQPLITASLLLYPENEDVFLKTKQ